jgi:succinyl-CoA synthetase beta subunit
MSSEVAMRIIDAALKEGRNALSEYEAKKVLAMYEIPVTREILVEGRRDLEKALGQIGYPLVMKGCSADIAHKTEKNLVRVDIRNSDEAVRAYEEIKAGLGDSNGAVLVQEMVIGRRELVLGMTRDPQFGACVMFGLGGIFTEVLQDIVFRKAPLDNKDAHAMMREIKGRRILEAVRGMESADMERLAHMLIQLGKIALENEAIAEIDVNPVILSGSRPVAVDALIVLKQSCKEALGK